MVLIHDIPGGIYINVKYGVLCMYVCMYIYIKCYAHNANMFVYVRFGLILSMILSCIVSHSCLGGYFWRVEFLRVHGWILEPSYQRL